MRLLSVVLSIVVAVGALGRSSLREGAAIAVEMPAAYTSEAPEPQTEPDPTSPLYSAKENLKFAFVDQCFLLPTDSDEWDSPCDIHGWVRAPDLVPGRIVPGEARLVLNGTCYGLSGWSVGLRFKERAVAKFGAKDQERPDTRFDVSTWQSGWSLGMDGDYQRPHMTVWDVEGADRVLFDTWVNLGPPGHVPPDGEVKDIVREFVVHMPNTNFPPVNVLKPGCFNIPSRPWSATETLLEYYFRLRIWDSCFIELPVGQTAFVPLPDGVDEDLVTGDDDSDVNSDKTSSMWPMTVNLKSWHPENARAWLPHWVPSCNGKDRAEFALTVDANATTFVQGTTVRLDMTLTRTGTGTEYPASLEVSRKVVHNHTWAAPFDQSEEGTDHPEEDEGGFYRWMRHRTERPSDEVAMLRISDRAALEERRDKRQDHEAGMYPNHRDSPPTYVFQEQGEGVSSWTFVVDLPIPHDAMPTFERTFESYASVLDLRLKTKFLCEEAEREAQKESIARREHVYMKESLLRKLLQGMSGSPDNDHYHVHLENKKDQFQRDLEITERHRKRAEEEKESRRLAIPESVDVSEWTEHELPARPGQSLVEDDYSQRAEQAEHTAQISVIVLAEVPGESQSGSQHDSDRSPTLVSYLAPHALGPVLARPEDSTPPDFPPLGTAQPEGDAELQMMRYRDPFEQGVKTCRRAPCGGQFNHAAKLWARREALLRGEETGEGYTRRFHDW